MSIYIFTISCVFCFVRNYHTILYYTMYDRILEGSRDIAGVAALRKRCARRYSWSARTCMDDKQHIGFCYIITACYQRPGLRKKNRSIVSAMSSTEGEKAPSKNDSSSEPKDSAGQMDPKKVCLQLEQDSHACFPFIAFF